MRMKDFDKLPCGLYIVLWLDGVQSSAAVGVDCNNKRWLAPTNWISPINADHKFYESYVFDIKQMIRIQ